MVSLGSSSIFCIGEEPSILWMLQQALEAVGYQVFTVTSAELALNILRQRVTDAVVLDCEMSLMDGLALALEIKRLRANMALVLFSAAPEQIPERLRGLASVIVGKEEPLTRLAAAVRRALAERPSIHAVRAYPRCKVDLRVLLTSGETVEPNVFWINVRSLGEGGIGADVPIHLAKDATVQLDLMLADRMLSVPSSVRYHSGPFHGFQFIDTSAEQRAAIRNYCQAYRA